MLKANKTKHGIKLVPRWKAFLFGGTYRREGGFCGYGWRPSFWQIINRYFNQGWWDCNERLSERIKSLKVHIIYPDILFATESNEQKWKIVGEDIRFGKLCAHGCVAGC
jgi:hypothetical protein